MKRIALFLAAVTVLATLFCSCLGGSKNNFKTVKLPEGLEIDTSTLSLALDTDPDVYFTKEFPLVASIPQDDVYIYDVNKTGYYGILVRFGDTATWFAWEYLSSTNHAEVYCSDYDGDGEKELAMSLTTSLGMTNHNEDLHIFKYVNGALVDTPYLGATFATEGSMNVRMAKKSGDTYTLSCATDSIDIDFDGRGTFQNLYFAARQNFTLGETIIGTLDIGFIFDNKQTPDFPGYDVVSTLKYNGTVCTAADSRLVKNAEEAVNQEETVVETSAEAAESTQAQ